MKLDYLKETTSNWETEYRVPCHTYIVNGSKLVGYIKESNNEKIMFSKSRIFNRKGRTFTKVKL